MTSIQNRPVIDEKLIQYLEDLSRISLNKDERERISSDLENILAGMELLTKMDVNMPSENYFNGIKTALRKDVLVPSFPQEEILKNAPRAMGDNFVVPKIVE